MGWALPGPYHAAMPRPPVPRIRSAAGRVVDDAMKRLTRTAAEDHRRLEERVAALEKRADEPPAVPEPEVAPPSIPALRAEGVAEHGLPALGHSLDIEATAARIRMALLGPTPMPERLDTDLGPLLYPSDDEVVTPWVRHHGSWEPETCDLIRRLLPEGGTFIDVGAHVGYLTITAARAVGPKGHGIAIEAAPENFRLLAANLATADVPWVVAIHAAAGDRTGRIDLSLSEDNSGDHRAVAL